jgi:hypothetical protein
MPIEPHAPGLERIVDLHAEIEELASGFSGERGPSGFSTRLERIWEQSPPARRQRMWPGETKIGQHCILPPGMPWAVSVPRFLGFLGLADASDRCQAPPQSSSMSRRC